MINELIRKEAEAAWDEDIKTNPNTPNPYAFTYGYGIAATNYTSIIKELEEENERLKKQINMLNDAVDTSQEMVKWKQGLIDKFNMAYQEQLKELNTKIKDLQAENERLGREI